MRFIRCEVHQGAIAAAQLEYPTRDLYSDSTLEPVPGVITPVVIDQLGDMTFLPSVESVHDALAAARSHIEGRNRSHVSSVLEDRMPANKAIQHFEDCGIPLELVPSLATERPYYPHYPFPQVQCLTPDAVPNAAFAH